MHTFKPLEHIHDLIQELKLELFSEAENGQQSAWDTVGKVQFCKLCKYIFRHRFGLGVTSVSIPNSLHNCCCDRTTTIIKLCLLAHKTNMLL